MSETLLFRGEVLTVRRMLSPSPPPSAAGLLGNGYLAGEYPGGATTVDGVPQSAEVRVLWRDGNGGRHDGFVVARTVSAADGTWRVDGLNPNLRYDVVGRKNGFNDVIIANVQPKV